MENLIVISNIGFSHIIDILKKENILDEDFNWAKSKTTILITKETIEELELQFFKTLCKTGRSINSNVVILSSVLHSVKPFLSYSELNNTNKLWNHQKHISDSSIYKNYITFSNWLIIKNKSIKDENDVQTWVKNQVNNYEKIMEKNDTFWNLILGHTKPETLCSNIEELLVKNFDNVFFCYIPSKQYIPLNTEFCYPTLTKYIKEPFQKLASQNKINCAILTKNNSKIIN